jgi:prepilin-type N-terminal cleavage/methylation domain-containing protein
MTNRRSEPQRGFTFVEVAIVVAVMAVLAVLLMPRAPHGAARAQRINCVNNLKQLGVGYRTWALDHDEKYPGQTSFTNGGAMEPLIRGDVFFAFQLMSNEISTPQILFCPADDDPKRKRANLFGTGVADKISFQSNTNTSYFAGMDAGTTNPSAFLSGDRNIAVSEVQLRSGLRLVTTNDALSWMDSMHHKQGNVGLADGSVQQFSRSTLVLALPWTGFQTNRLVFP